MYVHECTHCANAELTGRRCEIHWREPNVVGIRAPDSAASMVQLLRDALAIAERGEMTGVLVAFTVRGQREQATVFKQFESGLQFLGALRCAEADLVDWLRDKE